MSKQKRLVIVLLLNVVMIVGLVTVGLASHSVGVLAAGGDYAADAAAIAVSFLALRFSGRTGSPKATTYAALLNTVFMLTVTTIVIVESLRRLYSGAPQIVAFPVIVVSIVAVIVMSVCAMILTGGADNRDLSMQSVLLDTIADAGASAGVAVTGAVILVSRKYFWLDSAVALLIAIIITYHALKLFKEVLRELKTNHPTAK